MAKRNIEAFETGGAEYIVADAAGCGAALREYGGWFSDDPTWAEAAARFSDRVRDVMELVAEDAGTRSRTPTASTLETDPTSRAPRIAYDAPCHLLHAQRVDSAPLLGVRDETGLDLEPLPSSSDCCGGAGLYNLFHSELSVRVLERKVEEIRAGRYDAVATGNPGCIMQIGAGLDAAGVTIPVVHPVELLNGSE
jgi:glycolate oxidase iron-sulfur subunit